MNILIVDKSGIIPVVKYGGTERVIWGLGKELSKLGHQVFFLVEKGSSCDFATIIPLKKDVDIESQIPEYIDIVHINFTPKKAITSKPYLITMHGNPTKDEKIDINTVFISKNQAKRYNSSTYVYNGLDWGDYPTPILNEDKTYFHFLGKAAWKIKNVFGAAKIALKSKSKLYVLGGNRWSYRNFRRGLIYIFNPNIIFCGLVDNVTKMNIIKNSKGLIFPVLWHEPFGLAIIESLYAGCAVFGTKNGSLEELITPEVGFLGNNSNEIAEGIKNFDYNANRCHNYAVKHFNSSVMTVSYLKLYNKLLSGENLNSKTPKYIDAENVTPSFF